MASVVEEQTAAGALPVEELEALESGVDMEESVAVTDKARGDDETQLVDELLGEEGPG